ncbi:MAG: ABC transporter permease, partial [Planctomycetes bacterium]|nr:ABC transporter permease [Planctomycetota bacterium]
VLLISVCAAGTATAIALALGVPAGYVLARRDFPGKAVIQGLVDLPVVVPHTVAGIALLGVLGREGIVGAAGQAVGLRFVDAFPGTVAAMLFLSAPFVVNAARSGFEAVSPRLENVSRSLGAGPALTFFKVSMPLASGSILSGAVMCWARAVSEFGAIVIIAYYPRVACTLIYDRFNAFGLSASRPAAVLLVLLCLFLFTLVRLAVRGSRRVAGNA